MIPKGTIIVIRCSTGYCGMDSEEYFRLSQDYSEEELEDIASQLALDNAGMYGIYPESEYSEDEEEDSYYDGSDIYGYWEISSEEDATSISEEYL